MYCDVCDTYVMKKIGVAVLGYGFMGTTHLRAWKMLDDCSVLYLWGRDKARLEEVATIHGVKPVLNYREILDDERVDVVDVCTPTFTHHRLVLDALEVGKHVLVEKPLALTLNDADEMIRAARKAGRKLMVAHVLRFFPDYMKVKELVDQGALGEIVSARAWRGGPAPEWSPWFLENQNSGGVAVDLAIHDVDFLIWVNGGVPTRVFAKIRNLTHIGRNVHDFALINLTFPSGAVAVVEASWAMPRTFPFTMKLELDGTKGVIQLDNQSPTPMKMWTAARVESFSPEVLPWKPGVHPFPLDPFYREVKHFVDCIREDKKPLTDAEESKKSLATCLAAVESASKGVPVGVMG